MDILEKVKSAIVKGRINMTDHAGEELANDEILVEDLLRSVLHGEIMKSIWTINPFRAALCMARTKKGGIYTVFGHILLSMTLQLS